MTGLLVATAFAGSSAHAQIRTWSVTTGTWQTTTNWSANLVPTSTGTAAFVRTSNESSSLNADASVGALTFSGAGTKSITSDSPTARTLTIGTSGITISGGAGAVTLGDNTNPLNLAIAGNESWTNNSTSLFTVLGGVTGTAASGTSTLTVTGTGKSLLSGVIGNGGAGGVVAFTKSGVGTVTLSGNNTYTGATSISAGALRVTNSGGLGSTGAGTTITAGAALELSNNISIGAEALSAGSNNLGNSGGGALVNVSGNNSYAGNVTGIAAGGYYSNAGTLTLSGSVEGNTSGGTKFSGAGNINLTGTASLGNFQKFGAGTLTLAGTNVVSGSSTPSIFGGSVTLNSANHGFTAVSISAMNLVSGTFDLNGYNATITALALGQRPSTLPSSFIQDNTTANVLTGSGTLSVAGGINFGSSNNVNLPAQVVSGANATISGNLDIGNAARTWQIVGTTAANSALTVSANITGAVGSSITKTGVGTLVLSGSNSFPGAMTVNAGTLVLDYGSGQDNSKLATGAALTLGANGGASTTLTLKGGSFAQTVNGLTVADRGDSYINRNGGSSTLSVGALTVNGVLNIGSDNLVATTTNLANNILNKVFVSGTIATKSGNNIVAMTTWDQNPGASGSITSSNTQNVRITGGGGTVTLSSATTTINTLTNGATSGGTTTVDIGASGRSLSVTNGIVSGPGATALSIIGSGTLASSLFVNNSSNAITVNAMTSSAAITKSGTGVLVLAGTGASTTAVNLYAGTLQVDNANALGSAGSINFFDRSAGTLKYGSGITTDYSSRLTASGGGPGSIDTGTNNVTFSSKPGILIQKYGSGTLTLTATNNNAVSIYAGTLSLGHATDTIGANAVEVLGGTLDVANPDTVGAVVLKSGAISGAATFIGTSYTLTDTGTISANLGSTSATLQKLGAGTAVLSGNNLYTGTSTVTQGVLRLNSANALPGGIGASGGLSNLTINGGVVGLGNGHFARGLGSTGSTVQILDNGGGFAAYGANRNVNLGGASAAVTWGSGNFMTSSNPGNLIGSGTFVLGAADADAMVDFQNPLALTAAGVTASDWWVGTTRTIRVNNGSAAVDGRMSGVISDGWSPMGINKTGLGTLEMTAVNTYTGPTTISAGRMLFSGNGSLSGATGSVTVDGSGAELVWNSSNALTRALVMTQGTLSGTGTISATGGVTIGGNVILSPGNSPGTLPFTTGLTLTPGGTYVWEVNSGTGSAGTNWDLINVTSGGLNLAALANAAKFNLDLTTLTASGSSGSMDNYTPGGSYTWRIFDANALTLPGLFGSSPYAPGTDITSLFNLLTANWKNTVPAANDISVRVADNGTGIDLIVVPEPGTIALAGIGIAAAAYAYRRRRK